MPPTARSLPRRRRPPERRQKRRSAGTVKHFDRSTPADSAEAEYGIISTSLTSPLRDALAVSAAFAAGAVIPWLAIALIPGPSRAPVTFLIVLAALALTGWVSARISDVHPMLPMVRTAGIGGLSMLITYFAGVLIHP